VAVPGVEDLELLALAVEIDPAVGQDPVDVEEEGPNPAFRPAG